MARRNNFGNNFFSDDAGSIEIGVWEIETVPSKGNIVDFTDNTIDGVPLRKIYVRNIPRSMKKKTFFSLFERFGPLEGVDICKPKDYENHKFGFVTFKNPQSAKSAIKSKFIYLDRRTKLLIFPAFAHCQPAVDNVLSVEEEHFELAEIKEGKLIAYDRKESTESPIEMLNDYCLRHIFSFLSYQDLIRIERVCKYWKSIARALWRLEHQLDVVNGIPFRIPEKHLKLQVLQHLIKRCGSSLRRINLQSADIKGRDGLIDIIVPNCPELEEIKLQGLHISIYKINLLRTLSKLKSIALHDCRPLKDEALYRWFLDNSNLVHLEVTGCYPIDGSFLKSIKSPLETLNLDHSKNLSSHNLLKGLSNFSSSLTSLSLSNCTFLDADDVSLIVKTIPNLKSLTLNESFPNFRPYSLYPISELKHLEFLDLSYNVHVSAQLLSLLIINCQKLKSLNLCASADASFSSSEDWENDDQNCELLVSIAGLNSLPNLVSLNLTYLPQVQSTLLQKFCSTSPPIEKLYFAYCPHLLDEDLKSLVMSCSQLKHLDLSGCTSITSNGVNFIKEALNLRTNNQSLKLIVGGTGISKQISDSPDCPLLKISHATSKVPSPFWFNFGEDMTDDDSDEYFTSLLPFMMNSIEDLNPEDFLELLNEYDDFHLSSDEYDDYYTDEDGSDIYRTDENRSDEDEIDKDEDGENGVDENQVDKKGIDDVIDAERK